MGTGHCTVPWSLGHSQGVMLSTGVPTLPPVATGPQGLPGVYVSPSLPWHLPGCLLGTVWLTKLSDSQPASVLPQAQRWLTEWDPSEVPQSSTHNAAVYEHSSLSLRCRSMAESYGNFHATHGSRGHPMGQTQPCLWLGV